MLPDEEEPLISSQTFRSTIHKYFLDKIQRTPNEFIPIQCCNLQAVNLNHQHNSRQSLASGRKIWDNILYLVGGCSLLIVVTFELRIFSRDLQYIKLEFGRYGRRMVPGQQRRYVAINHSCEKQTQNLKFCFMYRTTS